MLEIFVIIKLLLKVLLNELPLLVDMRVVLGPCLFNTFSELILDLKFLLIGTIIDHVSSKHLHMLIDIRGLFNELIIFLFDLVHDKLMLGSESFFDIFNLFLVSEFMIVLQVSNLHLVKILLLFHIVLVISSNLILSFHDLHVFLILKLNLSALNSILRLCLLIHLKPISQLIKVPLRISLQL